MACEVWIVGTEGSLDFWTTIKLVLDISFAGSSVLVVSAVASSEAPLAATSLDFAFLFLACFFFTLNSQSNFSFASSNARKACSKSALRWARIAGGTFASSASLSACSWAFQRLRAGVEPEFVIFYC